MVNSEDVFKFIQLKATHERVQIADEVVTVPPILEGDSLSESFIALAKIIEIEANIMLGREHMAIHSPPVATGGGPVGIVN